MSDNSFQGTDAQVEAVKAAPEPGITANPEPADNGAPEEAEAPEPKTFTQEELDKIVGAEKAKAERRVRRELATAAEEAQRQEAQTPPDPSQYESALEYADALADFKAERILAEREQREQRTKADSSYADREEDARTKYTDYESVTRNPDLRITNEMAEVIKESEIGPEIAYHLGTNPKEAERIARLSPLSQAREIGRIEASLSANPPVRKTSSAPDPIKPVGSRTPSQTYDPSDPRSTKAMSDEEWIKARNRQVAKKYAQ